MWESKDGGVEKQNWRLELKETKEGKNKDFPLELERIMCISVLWVHGLSDLLSGSPDMANMSCTTLPNFA